MSEVKRYHVTEAGLVEGSALGRINVVLGADHDRVTAERDALQQRLTAADERADVLEGLLRDALLYLPSHGMGSVTFELNKRIIAALKPAEGVDYRRSCEAAHKAMSMENQRIVAPGQFKCLACGDVHPGSGNLPCPKMSPTA